MESLVIKFHFLFDSWWHHRQTAKALFNLRILGALRFKVMKVVMDSHILFVSDKEDAYRLF